MAGESAGGGTEPAIVQPFKLAGMEEARAQTEGLRQSMAQTGAQIRQVEASSNSAIASFRKWRGALMIGSSAISTLIPQAEGAGGILTGGLQGLFAGLATGNPYIAGGTALLGAINGLVNFLREESSSKQATAQKDDQKKIEITVKLDEARIERQIGNFAITIKRVLENRLNQVKGYLEDINRESLGLNQ